MRCRLVGDGNSADCWVINTCTVKSPSQTAMDNLLDKGRASGKAMVVAGCVPQGDRRARQLQGLSVIGGCVCAIASGACRRTRLCSDYPHAAQVLNERGHIRQG